MAKLDTSLIAGYEEMTAEEKLQALLEMELPEADFTGYVKKDNFDRVASQLSALKKEHNAMLTDEEKLKAEQEEKMKSIMDELETLRNEKQVQKYIASYIALGYDEKLAQETATALADGDMEKVFANQKSFLEGHDKNYKAELLKSSPRLKQAGDVNKFKSKEDIMNIKDATERQAAIKDNIELFK